MSGADRPSPPRRPMTLLEQLAPEVAAIRGEVYGCAGTNPYRVTVVVARWSNGAPGRGQREEVSRTELGCGPDCHGGITPPEVVLEGAWATSMHGLVEQGMAVVQKIDPTLTEAQLVAYGRLAEGEETWVEITQDGRDGDDADRPVRKYRISGPPFRSTKPLGWVLRLRSHEAQDVFPGGAP